MKRLENAKLPVAIRGRRAAQESTKPSGSSKEKRWKKPV